jgi:hypothetical protein
LFLVRAHTIYLVGADVLLAWVDIAAFNSAAFARSSM